MSRLHQLVVVHLALLLVVCIVDVKCSITGPSNKVALQGTSFNISCTSDSYAGSGITIAYGNVDVGTTCGVPRPTPGNPTYGPTAAHECDFAFTSIQTSEATIVKCNDALTNPAKGADVIVYNVQQCNVSSDVVQGQSASLECDITYFKYGYANSVFSSSTIEWSSSSNSRASYPYTVTIPQLYTVTPIAMKSTASVSVPSTGTTLPQYSCIATFYYTGTSLSTGTTFDPTQVTVTVCQTPALPIKTTATTASGSSSSSTTSGLSRAALLASILIPTLIGLLALGLGLWALYYWCFLANADRKKGAKPKQTSEPQQPLYYHPQGIWNPYTAQPPWGDAPRWIPPLRAPLFGGRRTRPVTHPLSYIKPGPPVQFLKMKELPKLPVPWAQSSSGSQFSQFFQPGIYKPRFPGQPYGI